jgi:hypothetical protein
VWRIDVVRFDAYEGVKAHPFELLSQRAEAVRAVFVPREVERRDIWLAVEGTSQTAKLFVSKEFEAFVSRHFLNYHVGFLVG